MATKKLIILAIALALVLANSGIAPAAAAVPMPPVPPSALSLKVAFSPLPIYPPQVIFTANLKEIVPSPGSVRVVDFYIQGGPTICSPNPVRASDMCTPYLTYIGSARIDQMGQAVLGKQLYPGTYTALAHIHINGETTWSNKVDFQVK